MQVVRPRGPGAGGVVAQRAPQHPAQRGPLARGANAGGPLDLERNAAHEIDARDRHPHERAARPVRPRHLTPPNVTKLMTASPYSIRVIGALRGRATDGPPSPSDRPRSGSPAAPFPRPPRPRCWRSRRGIPPRPRRRSPKCASAIPDISDSRSPSPACYFDPAMLTAKVAASALYGDWMYVSSKRISFNDFAFNADAGNSTSTFWATSWPGSRRSAP